MGWGGGWCVIHKGVGRGTVHVQGNSSPLPKIEPHYKCSSDASIDADAPNQSLTLSVNRPLWLISAARLGIQTRTRIPNPMAT